MKSRGKFQGDRSTSKLTPLSYRQASEERARKRDREWDRKGREGSQDGSHSPFISTYWKQQPVSMSILFVRSESVSPH